MHTKEVCFALTGNISTKGTKEQSDPFSLIPSSIHGVIEGNAYTRCHNLPYTRLRRYLPKFGTQQLKDVIFIHSYNPRHNTSSLPVMCRTAVQYSTTYERCVVYRPFNKHREMQGSHAHSLTSCLIYSFPIFCNNWWTIKPLQERTYTAW
jgi:hypothetical protein